ncbi:MAG: hypothetical protein AAFZ46_16475 [Pseudomonadota bacterium]
MIISDRNIDGIRRRLHPNPDTTVVGRAVPKLTGIVAPPTKHPSAPLKGAGVISADADLLYIAQSFDQNRDIRADRIAAQLPKTAKAPTIDPARLDKRAGMGHARIDLHDILA